MACVPVKEVTWPQPPLVFFSSNWVPESVIVPVAAMLVILSPVVLSAWVMQYRRSLELLDPLPALPRLLTVHVVESCARPSSAMTVGRSRRFRRAASRSRLTRCWSFTLM